jgi:hypothetical protein
LLDRVVHAKSNDYSLFNLLQFLQCAPLGLLSVCNLSETLCINLIIHYH